MIGVGISAGLTGAKRARSIQDPLPALDLDWATNRSLPAAYGPTPSFSRASTGTFFNSSGVLTTAAINAPRFNHIYNGSSWISKGLLIEEQRTNLIGNSEDLQNYATTGAITQNSTVAPDGTMTADTLTMDVGSGEYRIRSFPGAITSAFTASIYAKKGTHRYLQLRTNGGGGWANFDLETGSSSAYSGASASIFNAGNGWYRCCCTYAASSPNNHSVSMVSSMTSGYPEFITGTGTESFFMWGYQIEVGSFATSYIKSNSGSTTTRSADVCQISGADFSSFWNASEGSFALEADSIGFASTGSNRFFYAAQSGGVAFYSLDIDPTLGLEYRVVNSSLQAQLTHTQPNAGVLFKHSLSYKVNDFASSLNGSAVATDTSGTLPTATSLGVGYFPGFNQHGNCHISRLRYYPVRLPNATLQVLST